jgi:hypothetical protein
VVIVAYPEVQLLDVAGPLEVFGLADRFRPSSYVVEVITTAGAPISTSSGLEVVPHAPLSARTTGLDTVIVAGGTARSPRWTTSNCGHGCASVHLHAGESRRCAAARSCSRAPVCSTGDVQRRIGVCATS